MKIFKQLIIVTLFIAIAGCGTIDITYCQQQDEFPSLCLR